MEKITILALDPGETTGYAIAELGAKLLIGYGQREMTPKEFWNFLSYTLPTSSECYVVCESFEFRQGKQHTGINLYPCELIGILKLHRTFHIDMTDQLYFQPASVQGEKAYFSDKLLKELGLYIRGPGHGRSAVKHLLQWLQFGSGSRFGYDITKAELIDVMWLEENLRLRD